MRESIPIWCRCLTLLVAAASFGAARGDDDLVASRLIDGEISRALKNRNIQPAPRADHAELVRRIYLDILGRIPTAAETQSYLSDPAENKHHQLIDSLLTHEEMPVYWSTVFDEWLCGTALERDFGRDGFLKYLEDSLLANRPWNEIARELLAPDVADERQRSAAYFLAVRIRSGDNAEKLDNLTSAVATGLFGIQLQCAKCHDHPFVPEIRQDHYYGLAAFLGRTQEARFKDTPLVREKAEGEVTFITTKKEEKSAQLMFLDNHLVEEPPRPEDRNQWYAKGNEGLPDLPYFSRRASLAGYALKAESPYFKRAIVNRLWKQLLGRGLVEPVDQMHAANPPTHPALLEKLADGFAGQQFDLRWLMAAILHSETYLRSSQWSGSGERPRATDYAVALIKPLTPDQLATSISVATGHFAQFQTKLEREKQNRKIDVVTPAVARRFYARDREVQEFAARFRSQSDAFNASAGHALFLSYHSLMTRQLQRTTGSLVERLFKQTDHAAAAREAYLCVLSRVATEEELAQLVEFQSSPQPSQPTLCRELVWALLCSAEFRFNH